MSNPLRLIAYDPSLINLGVAYGYVQDDILFIEGADTFRVDAVIKSLGLLGTETDNDVVRARYVREFIEMSLENFKPDGVVMESLFFNSLNPQTLINQAKGSGVIQGAIDKYLTTANGRLQTAIYQPNEIKRAVGVKKENFKDKIAVKEELEKLIALGKIVYLDEEYLPNNQLDHANDAVAMLYTYLSESL